MKLRRRGLYGHNKDGAETIELATLPRKSGAVEWLQPRLARAAPNLEACAASRDYRRFTALRIVNLRSPPAPESPLKPGAATPCLMAPCGQATYPLSIFQ